MAGFDLQGSVAAGQGVVSPFAEALRKWEDQQKTSEYNDTIIQHAFKTGLIGLDDVTKYQGASATAKTGIAAGIAANIHNDMQRAQQEQQTQLARAHAAAYESEAMARNWAPGPEDRNLAYSLGGDYMRGPRGYQFTPYPESAAGQGPIQVDPFVDPVSQKPVPGMGIVRKTGQIGYFGSLLGAGGGVPIETDPATGMKFYRDAKGNPKPLKPADVMTSQATMPEGDAVTPAVQPTAAPTGFPKPGDIRKGYRFRGGDPSKQESWEKVQ